MDSPVLNTEVVWLFHVLLTRVEKEQLLPAQRLVSNGEVDK